MANTPRLDPISLKRRRIAELARQASDMVFTSLAHHIDRDMLHAAYVVTRKDGAVGLDGQTADDYAANLEANLQSLLDRFKSGQYVAPPVRRVHIPKGDGRKTRPIGIPTFEDKVLQRAVVMVLESVYEQDFRDCSFGFRPTQATLSVVLQVVGRPVSSVTPRPPGPRNCGHRSFSVPMTAGLQRMTKPATTEAMLRRFIGSLLDYSTGEQLSSVGRLLSS